MDTLARQFASPAFLHGIFLFFLILSFFTFLVGIGLALRSPAALRFNDFMNRWLSLRKLLKPAMLPHDVNQAFTRRPLLSGIFTTVGAVVSVTILKEMPASVFQAVFLGFMSGKLALGLAEFIKWFLLIGNASCIVAGLLMIFSPGLFAEVEVHADTWYSSRKHTRSLDMMHTGFDNWVLAHPTISGAVLSVLSLGIGVGTYVRAFG